MDKPTLIKACVEFVTVNGRPFTYMADLGFRKIINSIIVGLPTPVVINPQNVRNKVSDSAEETRYAIKEEVAGKLFL